MKRKKVLQNIFKGSRNIRFADMVNMVEGFGFHLSRVHGSHHIFIHPINIFSSEEDQGYIADIPDLQACSAFEETPEEALREVLKAKKLWLDAAQAEGKPVPSPRYRPAIYAMPEPGRIGLKGGVWGMGYGYQKQAPGVSHCA